MMRPETRRVILAAVAGVVVVVVVAGGLWIALIFVGIGFLRLVVGSIAGAPSGR